MSEHFPPSPRYSSPAQLVPEASSPSSSSSSSYSSPSTPCNVPVQQHGSEASCSSPSLSCSSPSTPGDVPVYVLGGGLRELPTATNAGVWADQGRRGEDDIVHCYVICNKCMLCHGRIRSITTTAGYQIPTRDHAYDCDHIYEMCMSCYKALQAASKDPPCPMCRRRPFKSAAYTALTSNITVNE